jgi:DNA-binding NarL/FixJ family response regulator
MAMAMVEPATMEETAIMATTVMDAASRANEVLPSRPDRAVRLAFIDDHPTLLRGLASLFSQDEGFAIVGMGETAADVEEIAATRRPDVMIVDLSMPGRVYEAISAVSAAVDAPKIIVFTAYDDTDLATRAMKAGAQAFVLKGAPSDDLGAAIRAVLQDELFISPGFTEKLIFAMRQQSADREPRPPFSVRERQIIDCLLEGKTNKEIARALELTEKTIKHYMTNLMLKLGVRNRVEVVLAVKAGEGNALAGLGSRRSN